MDGYGKGLTYRPGLGLGGLTYRDRLAMIEEALEHKMNGIGRHGAGLFEGVALGDDSRQSGARHDVPTFLGGLVDDGKAVLLNGHGFLAFHMGQNSTLGGIGVWAGFKP